MSAVRNVVEARFARFLFLTNFHKNGPRGGLTSSSFPFARGGLPPSLPPRLPPRPPPRLPRLVCLLCLCRVMSPVCLACLACVCLPAAQVRRRLPRPSHPPCTVQNGSVLDQRQPQGSLSFTVSTTPMGSPRMRGRGRHDRLAHCPRRLAEPELTAYTDHSPTSSQETTPLGGGLVGLCEARCGPRGATSCPSPSTPSASSTRPTTRSCRDPGRQVPKAVEHQDEGPPFWRRPSLTTPTSTSSMAARPQTRPSRASLPLVMPRRWAASGSSRTHWV